MLNPSGNYVKMNIDQTGGINMYNLLLTILLVLSVLLVIAIFMQPQKNPSSNVFDNSGSEALFERSKARGFEAFMQRFTAVLVFFWLLIALGLAILSSR